MDLKIGDVLEDTDNSCLLRVKALKDGRVIFEELDPETEEVLDESTYPLQEALDWGYPRLS